MTEPPSKTYAWTRIEVGYTILHVPKNPTAAFVAEMTRATQNLRELLSERLDPMRRLYWLTGHITTIDTPKGGHEWVAQLLTKELNAAMPSRPITGLEEKHLVLTTPRPAVGLKIEDKEHGTRCKLIGDRWFNYRSYSLTGGELGLDLPTNGLLYATLVWPCEGPQCDTEAMLA